MVGKETLKIIKSIFRGIEVEETSTGIKLTIAVLDKFYTYEISNLLLNQLTSLDFLEHTRARILLKAHEMHISSLINSESDSEYKGNKLIVDACCKVGEPVMLMHPEDYYKLRKENEDNFIYTKWKGH